MTEISPAHGLAVSRRFLDWEDVDLLIELAQQVPDGSLVVDIGAGSGTTALSIFEGNPTLNILTIDHSQDALYWAGEAVKNIGKRDQWESHLSDSVEAASAFAPASFPLVLLDTSHELQPTRDELNAWLPKIKTGGVLWCHDYRGTEVGQVVEEFVAAGRVKTIAIRGLGWAGYVL